MTALNQLAHQQALESLSSNHLWVTSLRHRRSLSVSLMLSFRAVGIANNDWERDAMGRDALDFDAVSWDVIKYFRIRSCDLDCRGSCYVPCMSRTQIVCMRSRFLELTHGSFPFSVPCGICGGRRSLDHVITTWRICDLRSWYSL